jgi:hypothetical protein
MIYFNIKSRVFLKSCDSVASFYIKKRAARTRIRLIAFHQNNGFGIDNRLGSVIKWGIKALRSQEIAT